ncbi:MAG: hypothetical protein RIQ98_866, partial [Bacteroidota bacterium]
MKNVVPKTFRFALAQAVLFVVLTLNISHVAKAQLTNLKFTTTPVTYTELVGGSNLIAGGSALAAPSAVTPIGFNFVYQGKSYSDFSVNAAGLLKLGSVVVTNESSNSAISVTNTPKIYAWWDATYTTSVAGGGGVTYALTGAAPNRVLTVQWKVAYTSNAATGFSYQIKLYETSNNIEFLYGNTVPTGTMSASAGLGNLGAREYISVYTFNHILSSKIEFSTNNFFPGAGAGRQYLFSPSFPSASPLNSSVRPSFWLKADAAVKSTRTLLNVPANRRTASSELNASWTAAGSLLTSPNGWISNAAEGAASNPTGSNALGQITLDLGSIQTVDGVATLGAGSANYFVSDFHVRVSSDNVTYTDLGLFEGNEVYNVMHYADFDAPVTCRFVRIIPAGYSTTYRAMRLDIYTKSNATGFSNNDKVPFWDDLSGNESDAFNATVANQPTFASNAINFNPAINFNTTSTFSYNIPDLTNIRQSYWVVQDANATAGTDYYHVLYSAGTVPNFHGGVGSTVQFPSQMTSSQGSWRKDGVVGSASSTYDFGPKGQPNVMTATALIDASPFSAQSISFQSGTNRYWNGPIAEIITFQNPNSATQQNIVESYLGIKYGISVGHDYLAADGTIIWNRTTNSTYHNNVFGFGRSDVQGLHQRQGFSSSYTGKFITLGNNSIIGATNAASSANNLSTDNSYLILGDNNEPLSYDKALSGNYYPLLRKWKVSNIGVSAATKIRVPAYGNSATNSLPISAIERYDAETVYFVIDSDGDGNFTNATFTAMSKSGSGINAIWETNQVIPNNAVIGFAVKQNSRDTDGDGVLDVTDIDDDNDGILDAREQVSCKTVGVNIPDVTFNGNAIKDKSFAQITSIASSSFSSSYSTSTFSLPISLKFNRNDRVGNAMFGLIPEGNTQTPANYTDNGYKFYFIGTSVYGYFGTAWNFNQVTVDGEEYSIDISATGYVTVKVNGVQKVAYQGINSNYRLVVTADNREVTFNNIFFSTPSSPTLVECAERDDDNDGIVNRMDLDSVNDGC